MNDAAAQPVDATHEEQNTGYVTRALDLARLARTRDRLGIDHGLASALAALRAEAEGWLTAGPWSVMDKTLLPASGDRHDYLSFGPYWWPDPATPDGLPFIRRDGVTNPQAMGPGSDRGSLERMAAGAETLALAWFFTGDERFARRAALFIDTWFLAPATCMHPHLRFGQAIPGRCDGRGIGIIETRRFIGVGNALTLLEGSSALGADQRAALDAWFASYLGWLLDSPQGADERGEHNNHGTWYDAQVAQLALAVGDRALATATLGKAVETRLLRQVEADGRQPHELARTRAFTYSLINLSGLFVLAELGGRCGIDFWEQPSAQLSRLKAACDFLAPFADPQRPWPYQEMTRMHRIRLFPFLRRAQERYGTGYDQWIALLPPEEVARDRANLL